MQDRVVTIARSNAVIMPNWLGDMVMCEPLLRTIKHKHGDEPLVLVGNSVCESLLPHLPMVDSFINIDSVRNGLRLRRRWQLAQQLKTLRVQRAYIVPNSLKSALIPFLANIPQRISYRGEYRYGLVNDMRDDKGIERDFDRFSGLIAKQNTPVKRCTLQPHLKVTAAQQQTLRQRFRIDARPILLIAPGAEYGPSKKWTQSGFDSVIEWALKSGYQVIIAGTQKDRSGFSILEQEGVIDLLGKSNVSEVVALCSIAQVVLCHDSGLMHVANAVSTAVIALYGPTDARRTPPLSNRATIIERRDLDCRPCYKPECPFDNHPCMSGIASQVVIDAIGKAKA